MFESPPAQLASGGLSSAFVITAFFLVVFFALGLFLLARRQRRHAMRRQILRRLRELEALRDASSAIVAAELDIVALSKLIATESGKVIDNGTFQVGLFEDNLYKILFWRVRGVMQKTPAIFDLADNRGIVGWVCTQRKPLLISDFDAEANSLPAKPVYVSDNPPRSGLFLPLISGNEVLGIMAAQHPEPNIYSEEDMRRLQIVANQASAAIANARLFEAEKARANDLEMVSSISRQVNGLFDSSEIFRQVVVMARDVLGFHPVTILSIDPETGDAVNEESSIEGLECGAMRVRPNQGLIGATLATRETVLVNDVSKDPRYSREIEAQFFAHDKLETKSEIAIPLLFDNQLLGVLDVQSNRVGGFAERQQSVLEALANEVAGAIDKANKTLAQREQAWVGEVQYQVAQLVNKNRRLDELAEALATAVTMLAGVEMCAFLEWDEVDELFRPISSSEKTADFHNQTLKIGDWTALDAVFVGQEPLTTQRPPPWHNADDHTHMQLFPMAVEGRMLGVMVTHDPPETSQTFRLSRNRRTELLTNIAGQMAQGLERIKLRLAQQEEAWVNTALLQVAEAMNRLTDLNEILGTIARLVPMLIGVESCILLIWDADKKSFLLGPSFGIDEMGRGLLASFDFDETEFLALREQGESPSTDTIVYTATLPTWMRDVIGRKQTEIVPLHARSQLVGALVVGPTVDGRPLAGKRLNILVGIAQQAAIAVVNDNLYKQSAERERLARDIDVALGIQASLIPDGSPTIPGCRVASYWGGALEVSGDFYDFMVLPNGNWGIVIADVAGKGIPAAIFMTLSRTIIRAVSLSPQNLTAAEILMRANRILLDDSHSDMFVTALFAIWDAETGTLTYTNAGHTPPLLVRTDGSVDVMGGYGIALGVIDPIPLVNYTISIGHGETVLLYTDGITEAMNRNYDTLGLPRLRAMLAGAAQATPHEIVTAVNQLVVDYADGMPQSDDVTMVAIKRD